MNKIFSRRFLGFIRDGVAYSFSWFVILVLIIGLLSGQQDIGVDFLGKLLVFCVLAAIEFTAFFSDSFITNKGFMLRLNGFVAFFLPTEIAFLYITGILTGAGTVIEWAIFVGIIVVLYLICVILDKTILRKQGQEYTSQLDKYKEKRKDENAN